jgi:photosystem II stability/assembly factor-like uncharacterized protein
MKAIQFKKKHHLATLTLLISLVFAGAADGQTWHKVTFPLKASITGASFISADTGHLVTNDGKHARTFDGGEKWWGRQITRQFALEDCHFSDAMTGFVCGEQGQIHYTLDGGDKWHDVSWPDTSATFISVRIVAPQTVIATGFVDQKTAMAAGILLRSTDMGQKWEQIELPGKAIGDLFFESGRPLMCISFGQLNRSTDLGKTWSSASISGQPGRTLMVRDSTGLMIGNHAMISTTFDGGNSWHAVHLAEEECHFTSAVMVNDTIMIVGGTNATVYVSKTAGRTWDEDVLVEDFHITDLEIAGDWLWAVGSNGTILRKKIN